MTEETKLALRPLVRDLRGSLTQPQLTAALGYEGDRASKLEQFGPTLGSLPKLARYAAENGRSDLAAQFMRAFLEDYPDLLPTMQALKSILNLAQLQEIDVKDVRVQQLCAQVDRIVKSGKEAAITVLEGSIKIAVELSKMGE